MRLAYAAGFTDMVMPFLLEKVNKKSSIVQSAIKL